MAGKIKERKEAYEKAIAIINQIAGFKEGAVADASPQRAIWRDMEAKIVAANNVNGPADPMAGMRAQVEAIQKLNDVPDVDKKALGDKLGLLETAQQAAMGERNCTRCAWKWTACISRPRSLPRSNFWS